MLGTLKRAGDVLDLFTVDEPEWGVTATAQRLGVGKSLAHDVLTSLAAIGLLQRVGRGHYRLGWRTISLASVLIRTSELKLHARPVVRELAERQGLTVSLVAWDRGRIIYIDRRRNRQHANSLGPTAGTVVPVDGSAAAKVLLASRPDREIESLWDEGSVQSRHSTLDLLTQEIEQIRLHGWASDDSLHPEAAAGVAAPVRDAECEVAAAISLELGDALPGPAIDFHARVAVAAASRISEAIRHAADRATVAPGAISANGRSRLPA